MAVRPSLGVLNNAHRSEAFGLVSTNTAEALLVIQFGGGEGKWKSGAGMILRFSFSRFHGSLAFGSPHLTEGLYRRGGVLLRLGINRPILPGFCGVWLETQGAVR